MNPAWEDADTLRLYAFSVGANGVDGLPAAVLFDPSEGNAIENDASITSMQVLNANAEVQDRRCGLHTLHDHRHERPPASLTLPRSSAYNLVLEQQTVDNIDGNITIGWTEIATSAAPSVGTFRGPLTLVRARGRNPPRRMVGYEGGDTLCPGAELRPDDDCAVPFNLSIDTYEPNLLSMSVFLVGPTCQRTGVACMTTPG